ncbi:helix-turn-helix domain-containing protein [Luteolibacter ambystomatis]|uniref:Helix-turn-helix domain-containing protein n=1 Tax=Luteolibacter ambystomatis TaxID=2824561 RepID=A0A975IXX0_9BACT|nr:helix-turn-helix domain-containing protein [Luteolibacter ambystomatis]QUE49273.1 helix-turn-helix domain-containing protein [Luteolibacter ambystomatis]
MKSSRPTPAALQTATEIAVHFNVDPRTIHYWAANGSIPVAFRKDKIIRFRLEDVLAANQATPVQMTRTLAPQPGEVRSVELSILALSLLLGPEFPRIPTVDLDNITLGEVDEIQRLCSLYETDLNALASFEERAHYAEGVIEGARAAV